MLRKTMSRTKAGRARQAVARASKVLRARSAIATGGYGPLASRGFYGAYTLRGRNELKFTDVTLVNDPVLLTWKVNLLNGIAQGTDYNQRIGRKAQMKSVLVNGNLFPTLQNSGSSPVGCFARIVVIYDTQPNSGSLPAGTDIFASNDTSSPMNLNNRDRFKVIYDKRMQIGSYLLTAGGALSAGSPNNVFWSKWKSCNYEIIFSGTAATIGSISTGALYLCYTCDYVGGVGTPPSVVSVDWYTRVRFIDA